MLNSGPFVTGLQQRVERLEEENAELRAMLGLGDPTTGLRFLGFTETEARIVNLLLAREAVTREQVMFAMHPNDPDKRYDLSYNLPSVHMTRIRARLKPLGAGVRAFWGKGWWMDAASKEAVRRALNRPLQRAAE